MQDALLFQPEPIELPGWEAGTRESAHEQGHRPALAVGLLELCLEVIARLRLPALSWRPLPWEWGTGPAVDRDRRGAVGRESRLGVAGEGLIVAPGAVTSVIRALVAPLSTC